jgi:hypothetical protein
LCSRHDARFRLLSAQEKTLASVEWDADDFAKAATWAARGDANYLLLQDAEGVMDEVTDSLGLPRINHELALFGWQDGAWQKMKSWPVPPDLDGSSCRYAATEIHTCSFVPPELSASIELVSCRELLAASKMLLHRAGSKSKATGCRIK